MVQITKERVFDVLEYEDEKLNLLVEHKKMWKVQFLASILPLFDQQPVFKYQFYNQEITDWDHFSGDSTIRDSFHRNYSPTLNRASRFTS